MFLTENGANFTLWESREAMEFQRPHRSVSLERSAVVGLFEKNSIPKVEWQFLNGAYVEVTGRFVKRDYESDWSIGEIQAVTSLHIMPRRESNISVSKKYNGIILEGKTKARLDGKQRDPKDPFKALSKSAPENGTGGTKAPANTNKK